MSATSDELSRQLSAMPPIVERPHGVATAHIDRDISKRIGRDGVVVQGQCLALIRRLG